MKNIILYLKGFFMGIANIIPGVSGGTIAIILGIYEDFIKAISHLFENIKKNLLFILPIVLGMGSAIAVLSGVIKYSYDNFPFPTMLFFVGLVLGGIPMLLKNVKGKKESKKISSYVIFALTFSLVIIMTLSDLIFGVAADVSFTNMSIINYIVLFIVGIIAAATMVIPGVSGSLVLMLLGYYYPIVSTINDLVKFNNVFSNVMVLGVFGIGVVIGIVLISKLLEMLFKKYKVKTYFGVLGFIFASVIAIPLSTFIENDSVTVDIQGVIIGILMLFIGTVISNKLGDRN